MKNIEDSFAQQEVDMKFSKDKLFNDTQKSEAAPLIQNEYIQDTQLSKDKREISSRSSSQRPETARGLVWNSRPISRSQNGTKVLPASKLEEKEENYEKNEKKEIKLEYQGDVDLLKDESNKSNNFINTTIFMIILGFMAFFSLFCWIYAYSEYSQSVILSSLLMMLVAALVEVIIIRPLTCLIITLVIMVKRKVKSKEILMREIEEVKEELNLDSSIFKDKSDEKSKENSNEENKEDKIEILQIAPDANDEINKDEVKNQTDLESQNKSATVGDLKQDAMLDKLAKRPEKK